MPRARSNAISKIRDAVNSFSLRAAIWWYVVPCPGLSSRDERWGGAAAARREAGRLRSRRFQPGARSVHVARRPTSRYIQRQDEARIRPLCVGGLCYNNLETTAANVISTRKDQRLLDRISEKKSIFRKTSLKFVS
jgi:hypothetical protein